MSVRSLAADWCAILACDRATDAWSIKLHEANNAVMRIAWDAYVRTAERPWFRTPSERWAEAEAMLRSGRWWKQGAWRTFS